MEKLFNRVLLLLLTVIYMQSCTKPLKDVNIVVDTNVFKHTAVIEVKSTSGQMINNATVTLSGPGAAEIYNADGLKSFKLAGGMILLALNPKVVPAEGTPVSFNVNIEAPDYLPVSVPVKIYRDQTTSLVTSTMINTKTLPEGVKIQNSAVPLAANGATTAPVTVSSTTGGGVTETVKIEMPAGTQFRDEQGNVIAATSLSVSTLVGNTSNDEVLRLFPGGGLSASEVKTSSGATTSGTLLPAALTEISMTANNTPVRNFSQPIELTMQLEPGYINPATGAVIKSGEQLQTYSYSTDKGVWEYESTGTVVVEDNKLVLKMTTTHLTWFIAGSYVESCSNDYNISFSASWLANEITHPVTYRVFSVVNGLKDKELSSGKFTVTNGTEASIKQLPSSAVIISFFDVDDNQLATQTVANPCAVTTRQTVTLATSPVSGNPKVTMQLYVRCPGYAQTVTLLPTFYLYYKEAGQSESAFKMVGTVTAGYISTNLLTVAKTYDFKAVWSTYVKYANGKTVQADNTATVGTGPGDIIGTKNGANNLQMLTEACAANGYK